MDTEINYTTTWSGLPIPSGWHIDEGIYDDYRPTVRTGHIWERLQGQRITVMEDISVKADGKRWLHVSVAKPNDKLPTWEDLAVARKLFIGNRECYQIFPTEDRYINAHNVLHLWCCLDEPNGVLPHFEATVNGVLSV